MTNRTESAQKEKVYYKIFNGIPKIVKKTILEEDALSEYDYEYNSNYHLVKVSKSVNLEVEEFTSLSYYDDGNIKDVKVCIPVKSKKSHRCVRHMKYEKNGIVSLDEEISIKGNRSVITELRDSNSNGVPCKYLHEGYLYSLVDVKSMSDGSYLCKYEAKYKNQTYVSKRLTVRLYDLDTNNAIIKITNITMKNYIRNISYTSFNKIVKEIVKEGVSLRTTENTYDSHGCLTESKTHGIDTLGNIIEDSVSYKYTNINGVPILSGEMVLRKCGPKKKEFLDTWRSDVIILKD